MVLVVAPAWRRWPIAARVTVAILVALWWGAALRVSADSARYAVRTGNDFAEDCWRDSPLASWVRANGSGHDVYTNAPEALYFHAGRLSHELPEEMDAKTVRAFTDTVARRRALVVDFDESCGAVSNSDSVLALVPLRVVATMPTGRVLETLPDSARLAAVPPR
jgi:hypothetical protein